MARLKKIFYKLGESQLKNLNEISNKDSMNLVVSIKKIIESCIELLAEWQIIHNKK